MRYVLKRMKKSIFREKNRRTDTFENLPPLAIIGAQLKAPETLDIGCPDSPKEFPLKSSPKNVQNESLIWSFSALIFFMFCLRFTYIFF